jgi:hypothetical protein
MSFIVVVDRVIELLRSRGRIMYRALKREFDLDDEFIEDLKEELIEGQELAVDKDGKVLVWAGASPVSGSRLQEESSKFQDSGSKSGLRTPNAGLPCISPSASGPNKQLWKPVA